MHDAFFARGGVTPAAVEEMGITNRLIVDAEPKDHEHSRFQSKVNIPWRMLIARGCPKKEKSEGKKCPESLSILLRIQHVHQNFTKFINLERQLGSD